MKEDGQYYTPDIEEVRNGLEMQVRYHCSGEWDTPGMKPNWSDWEDFKWDGFKSISRYNRGDGTGLEYFHERGTLIDIRVKFLKRYQIEECGWIALPSYEMDSSSGQPINSFQMGDYGLRTVNCRAVAIFTKNVSYGRTFGHGVAREWEVVFNGTILNKTELLFQMKRLAIS